MSNPPNRPQKVLLIGWDAADWNVALPLIEQGKMPTLKRLMDEGVWGNLATIQPILSPMLWTSIATGKRAWKHGIHGFSEPCPATGGIRPITNLSRKTKALWNIFHQQGWRSNVVGWWPSQPAEPINGVMISNHFQQAVVDVDKPWPMRSGTVHPKRLEEPLKEMRIHPAELENGHILPFIPRAAEIDQAKDKRMATCAKTIAEISSIHAAATACMQLEPWDFMAVYYDGIDHFGHGFMKYHPPRQPWISERDFELYQGVIEAGYRYHDMMLDTLLNLAGEDTTVMLISDHGFEPGNLRPQSLPNEPAGPAAEHSPYGIFCMRGPGIKKGGRVYGASLLDVAPTLLHHYGLPVGRDMDGRVLVDSFEDPQSIEFIDSWDDVEGEDGSHPKNTDLDVQESRESIRQLVDLGYIDEPDEDASKAIDGTLRELKYNLAQAYMDGGKYLEADKILKTLQERWPEESRFGVKRLGCFLALEDADKSREALDLLIANKKEQAPKAAESLKALQEAFQKRIEEAKVKAEAEGVDFIPPELSRAEQQKMSRLKGHASTNLNAIAFLTGSVLALEKRYEEAIEMLKQAEAAQTANLPSLYAKMGQVYLAQKQWDEAIKAFEKILEITAQDVPAYLGRGRAYLGKGLYFEASRDFLQALELRFHNPMGHMLLGICTKELDQHELAESELLIAIAQNPYFPVAHLELAKLYSETFKQPKLAEKHYQLAKEAETKISEHRHESEPQVTEIPEFPKILSTNNRIADDTEFAVIVSGLPRSGTSLMMQMLEAGGLPMMTDGIRKADTSNLKGYYEHEKVKQLARCRDKAWLLESKGKGIKIIATLLGFLPTNLPAKVIFLQRPMEEILGSQRQMLDASGKRGGDIEQAALAKTYVGWLNMVNRMTENRNDFELLPINYLDILKEPNHAVKTIFDFLKIPLDTEAMGAVVDPRLHRTRFQSDSNHSNIQTTLL